MARSSASAKRWLWNPIQLTWRLPVAVAGNEDKRTDPPKRALCVCVFCVLWFSVRVCVCVRCCACVFVVVSMYS
jgi:hypothetical protein